ncbi:peptidase S41 family protein [Rhizoctonia solani]|uniref:Peptidase S41 family protein n=1 Tax=Rhizoctonia solani TaxID=456999 RepID=A0A8H7I5U9_9AGAM|nr:peptidase S41 family protein [Rhizoctonia solani]
MLYRPLADRPVPLSNHSLQSSPPLDFPSPSTLVFVRHGHKELLIGLGAAVAVNGAGLREPQILAQLLLDSRLQKDTPSPFTEATSNLDVEFARIKATKIYYDYDFNRDIYNVINHLDDGHPSGLPSCYWAAFQNILPAPLVALEKNGTQDIYIAPNTVEFISLIGLTTLRTTTRKASIGKSPYHRSYVNGIATTYSGDYIDHNIRTGDFGGPVFPDKDSLTLCLIPANSTKTETVKNIRELFARRELMRKKRRPVAEISVAPAKSVGLPQPNLPTQPDVINGTGVIKAYVLPDDKTGVLMVGSFGGDYVGFQNDTLRALSKLKAAKSTDRRYYWKRGRICEFLINALAEPISVTPLARKIVESYIEQGIDYMSYSPNQWAFLNNTPQPANYNYIEPPTNFTINLTKDAVSKRFYDICMLIGFASLGRIIIVGNGECASTCALFTGVAYERLGIKVATFGGNPGAAMNFNGMAGNQVLEWADLDSEIKTAGLKNDSLAPPDHQFELPRPSRDTTILRQMLTLPPAFHVERAQYRVPYTADTYMSPQNLWAYV